MNRHTRRGLFILACLAPATILVILFIFYPTFDVFRTSLYQKTNFVSDADFAGFKNFEILFQDQRFVESLQNTVLYVVVVTLITIVLSLFFATLLTRENFRFKRFFQTVFYIPNILSMVVIAGIFGAIYQPSNGLLNTFLDAIGLGNLKEQWLGDPRIVNYSIMAVLVWQAIGYYMVMYMSSMDSIPEQLYEAANLESATKWQQFYMITLPLIWNNIRTTLTFFITSTINLSFMFVQLTTEGSLGTESLFNYMFSKASGGQYSYGMAIGVIAFVFTFILAATVNKISERDVYEYGG